VTGERTPPGLETAASSKAARLALAPEAAGKTLESLNWRFLRCTGWLIATQP